MELYKSKDRTGNNRNQVKHMVTFTPWHEA